MIGKFRTIRLFATASEARPVEGSTTVWALLAQLKTCTSSRDLKRGKGLHEAAIQTSDDSNVYVANSLMNMYAKCGCLNDARQIFDSMQDHNVVSWTTLISGYAENGEGLLALDLFSRMVIEGCVPNSRTFVAALKSCSDLTDSQLLKVKDLHSLASKSGLDGNLFVQGTLVDVYAKCGSMKDARAVFDEMQHPNVVAWNALIFGYADNGESLMGLHLFVRMRCECCPPDTRTFVAALKCCTGLDTNDKLLTGMKLHLLAIRSGCSLDIYVQGILLDMYAKCGSIKLAHKIFDSMKYRNVVCWNTLILRYVDNGECEIALDLYWKMTLEGCTPNTRTVVAALKACTDIAVEEEAINQFVKISSWRRGKALHLLASRIGTDSDVYVLDTLVDMYGKCGSMEDAHRVFDSIGKRNVVCWTALILGYADNGEGFTALDLFLRMIREDVAPNEVTFVAALKACIDLALKEEGQLIKVASKEKGSQVHMLAVKCECDYDVRVKGTLVDMFSKCGSMQEAHAVFDNMMHPDVVAWTALIMGYADNGEGVVALDLFSRMRRQGCQPNTVTFTAALKAGAMIGDLEIGKEVHAQVCKDGHEIDKFLANVLVDIYAKCGKLVEAQQLFDSQRKKDLVAWNTLMGGYGCHGQLQCVFDLFERMGNAGLQPNDVTFLCLLSACSHAGLIEKGMSYLKAMPTKYGTSPTVEHYNCMLDTLGRANKLDEAMTLMRSMTCCPDGVAWVTVLGACRKWKYVELARLAVESLVSYDKKYATAYVQMANIYEQKNTKRHTSSTNNVIFHL